MGEPGRKDLGFLGEPFQFKLVHEFMSDKDLFSDLSDIIDQNMFTDPTLKVFVGIMKDYADKYDNSKPSYDIMLTLLYERAHNEYERDTYEAVLNKVKNTSSEGSEYVKDLAIKFFKQQNIIKTANEILRIAGDGDMSKYDKCVDLLTKALNSGVKTELGVSVFDNLEETLSEDYRTAIPTGIGKVDETLEGGIGKGELGVIIGPSSFGKSQPMESLILTPEGWVEMRDMKVGSNVIGPDGGVYKVSGVFPQGKRPIYKVGFSSGSFCECDIEHLWNVQTDIDFETKTLTLSEIIDGISEGRKYYVQFSKSVVNSSTEYMYAEKRYRDIIASNAKKTNLTTYKFDSETDCEEARELALSMGYDVLKINDLKLEINNGFFFGSDNVYNNGIISIEYVGEKEAQCIMVDSKEHLYITDGFIVTHNTSLTTAMASNAAENGYKVLQIVFEDQIKNIKRKHIAKITGVESKDLSKEEYVNIVRHTLEVYRESDASEKLQENLKILRLPTGEKTAWDIERIIKKFINNGFKPDMLIVDYFECLKHRKDVDSTNEYEKEGVTMRKFESMAGEYDMAIWIPTQGTKDSVNAELVTMDKAGGSFKKIQVAHIIMSIARTVEDIAESKATVAILKNRAGQAGKIFENVEFNNGTCRISTDNVQELDGILQFKAKQNEDAQEKQIEIFNKIVQQQKK